MRTSDYFKQARLAARLLQCAALGTLLTIAPAHATDGDNTDLIVTVLGSGTPSLNPERFGSAYLVQAGGLDLLIDAGRGVTVRLGQAGLTAGDVDAVFITHFHSDHVNGLADLFLTGYIEGSSLRGRQGPMALYGPKGTSLLAEGLLAAHQWDIETRIVDEQIDPVATTIETTEISQGVVFEQGGVTVTVFPVMHGENIDPAVGYRIDYAGKSVLISGDTMFDPTVIENGQGVDLLIHELGMATPAAAQRPAVQRILGHHTTPAEVGTVFSATAPDLAVLSHMVLIGGARPEEAVAGVRETYNGPLIVAEDLTCFILSENGVTVMRARR